MGHYIVLYCLCFSLILWVYLELSCEGFYFSQNQEFIQTIKWRKRQLCIPFT